MNDKNNSREELSSRKRHKSLTSLAAHGARVPLTETSGNLPSPVHKKAKLNKLASIQSKNALLVKPLLGFDDSNVTGKKTISQKVGPISKLGNRLEGGDLLEWQKSWRPILKKSIVYFDTQGIDSSNNNHQVELKRAQRALRHVGCTLSPFYDREVTIIVSRRQFGADKEYASNDIFQDASIRKIRVWNYEKVFRFMENLGVNEASYSESKQNGSRSNDLVNLLREEKIFGANDRDPNAKRDDLHYLEKDYLYVYDLSQNVRPIAIREWPDDAVPALCLTLDGKCPFIADNGELLERKKQRRKHKFETSKNYRELLKKVSEKIIENICDGVESESSGVLTKSPISDENSSSNMARDANDKEDDYEQDNDATIAQTSTSSTKRCKKDSYIPDANKIDFKVPAPATLTRDSSSVLPLNNSNSKFYDVAASGYNGASNAAQASLESGLQSANAPGNGLGPTVSQVPSKNISNLKRRIFMKKQKQINAAEDKDKDLKPGYCENCRVKYSHFDDHIKSKRHRNFACDDRNFNEIDDLISLLHECKSMGYITSNGDYSYA